MSITLEILVVVLLVVVIVSLTFILGQVLNGVSASILDRLVVRKLLHYPFELYQRHRKEPDIPSHRIFRAAVLEGSYLVHCVNVVPVILLEITICAGGLRPFEGSEWNVWWAAGIAVLTVVHLGVPPVWSRRRHALLNNRTGAALLCCHAVVVVALATTLILTIASTHDFTWIFALVSFNALLVFVDRWCGGAAITAGTTTGAVFLYVRLAFINIIYWSAKLVNYGDLAHPKTTADAEQLVGANGAVDLFWSSYLTVQNLAPRSFLPISHFLALYGMMRNLCNATMFVWLYSAVALLVRPTIASGGAVLAWSCALAILGFLCFSRYLYLYASYFSKYVIRAAAVLQRLNRLGLLKPEPDRR